MFGLSDSHHFRKTVAGVSMILAPLMALLAVVIAPERKENEAAMLASVAADADAFFVSQMLILGAIVVAIPAVLGLVHVLREKEVAYGHVGGGLALVGLVAIAGVTGLELVVWRMAETGGAGIVALYSDVMESAGVVIPLFFGSLGFGVGMLVLGMGLHRAKAVAPLHAVSIALGGLLLAVSGLVYAEWVTLIGAALLFAGLGMTGRLVLAESDEDWEHTPEAAVRPLLGAR
ncbi:MAG: hypothetical protein H0V29_07500 [Thermoleophilaceae bacterium]|nr:hypothetical protein [Thermoleophilaceae bacterium]